MRKLLIITIISLMQFIVHAQDDSIKLADLAVPNSPAFILLDQAPTTISTPKTTKAFVLGIVNAFQDGNSSGFPQNYAVDFTPYWFFRNYNMDISKYAGATKNGISWIRPEKISLSLAYMTGKDTVTYLPMNNISFGLRANILSIRRKSNKDSLINSIKELTDVYLADKMAKRSAWLQTQKFIVADHTPAEQQAKYAEFDMIYDKNNADVVAKREEDIRIIERNIAEKPLVSIDAAFGYNNFYLDNDYSNGHFGRLGVWLNGSVTAFAFGKAKKSHLNFYVIGRYLSDGMGVDEKKQYIRVDNFDFGGKAELEFKKLSLSYEYIYRSNALKNTFRSNGLVKYKINDQIYLTGAFGKNFGENKNLISMLGLNWGFSTGNEKSGDTKKQH